MATGARLSEASVMYVIAVVAINAAATRGVHLRTGACMTRYARKFRVCAIYDESGFLVMVKVPDTPVACVVTDITLCPELSLVRIVFSMATDALTRRVLESPGFMTILACHFQMAAQQGKTCFRVIKPHTLPACLPVTALTTCPLLANVNIILPVA